MGVPQQSYVENCIRPGGVQSRPHLETHMQKMLHINPDKCTGCLQCEMACSFENYGTYATSKSRIKVCLLYTSPSPRD